MKNYTITVNGNVYDVTVEEKGAGAVPALKPAPESSCRLRKRHLLQWQKQRAQETFR